MILVSQKFLSFAVFDSPEFGEFMRTALELGKSRYKPITSYNLKKHIESVYAETKVQVNHCLLEGRGSLHFSIDSCTFNTTKNIFNVIAMTSNSEWYIGHAEINHLEKKNTAAISRVFLSAIRMIEELTAMQEAESSAPGLAHPTFPQGTSFWDQIPHPTQQSSVGSSSFFAHPIATPIVDGPAVNKSALKELARTYPELMSIICTGHGLNLMMKHLVNQTPWMSKVESDVGDIIMFFRNKSRPREILSLSHPYQLKAAPVTRFCYLAITLQSFIRATKSLKQIGSASLTDPPQRSEMQVEWIKLRTDLSGLDLIQYEKIQQLVGVGNLYERVESLYSILLPIYLLFRLFDKSSPGACSWVFCSLLHLRQVLNAKIRCEFQALHVVGTMDTLACN